VVLSTRNRGCTITETLRTILANDHPSFELIVVDQSEDDRTCEALSPFRGDSRLRYIHSARRGRSAGLNEGIREARGLLIATTDDDCTVPTDWLRSFDEVFAIRERVGIVFGNVLPTPHDHSAGCIPAYVRDIPFLARSIRDRNHVEGMGACMAMRRSVWQSLGGFDEMLGAGARFHAGEDGDLALRALLAGYWIYETPAVQVDHHGLREWKELPSLIDHYWQGTGAMLGKAIRLGHWGVLAVLLLLAARWTAGRSRIAASLGRPARLRKLVSFGRGFFRGLACQVDIPSGLYISAPQSQPAIDTPSPADAALRSPQSHGRR
jgi:GT2 family glycosyltransferase